MSETPQPPPPAEELDLQLSEPETIIFPEEQAISDAIDEAVAAAIPASDNIQVDEVVAASIAAADAPANELPQQPDPVDESNTPSEPEATETPVQYEERPLGPVCQLGQEQTGRWTRDEQERFIEGLERYGKEWKKVAAVVETRTIVQVRTHAQKFQKKLSKIFRKPTDQVSVADFNGVTDSVGGRNRLKVNEGELKRFENLHKLFTIHQGGYGNN